MAANNILVFGATASNELNDAAYAADAQRLVGNQPGVARSPLVNKALHQTSVIAAGVAEFLAGRQNTAIVDTLTPGQIATMLAGILGGASWIKGLVGNNNVATPSTQYDVSAASVTFRNSTTGDCPTVQPVGVKTANISTAGPVANGRDQAGVFTASTWIHLHWIYNQTTAAADTIWSTSATAPTLPAGYTASAYATSVVLNASTQLNSVKTRGAWASYDAPPTVLAGSATTLTAFSTAAAVPPNALEWRLLVSNFAFSAASSGLFSGTLFVDSYQSGISGTTAASGVVSSSGGSGTLPNSAQSASYRALMTQGSGPAVSLQAQGYKLPNGGE